ncbi:MAG TPA: metallophosphoesterase [Ktedonobacterales bacterium]|nr:metallophosphoesterase [Ktedonobacterales bacterium]
MFSPTQSPTARATAHDRTFAIGDLHGEVTLLRRLLAAIQPQPTDTLIFLGDYVDRGEDSVATVEELEALRARTQVVAIQGNHDAAWLEVWTGHGYRHRPAIPGARAIWEQYRGLLPVSIGRFLETTVLTYEDEEAYYSHAGAHPGRPFWQTPASELLWGPPGFWHERDDQGRRVDWGKPVVCGHYEVEEPVVTPIRICLDTAAYRTGVLSALELATPTLYSVRRTGEMAARVVSW